MNRKQAPTQGWVDIPLLPPEDMPREEVRRPTEYETYLGGTAEEWKKEAHIAIGHLIAAGRPFTLLDVEELAGRAPSPTTASRLMRRLVRTEAITQLSAVPGQFTTYGPPSGARYRGVSHGRA